MKNFLFIVVLFTIYGCNSQNEHSDIQLTDWLKNEKNYLDFENYYNSTDATCDSLLVFYKKIKLDEFKNKARLKLGSCFLGSDNEKAILFLSEAFSSGQHISWIQQDFYAAIYDDLKQNFPANHSNYWQEKDTSYFQIVEDMVKRDQMVIKKYIEDPSVQNQNKEERIHSDNATYLLNYSIENGFPKVYGPGFFEKKDFRININPTILAVHAPIEKKIELRHYAIESAKKGINSWRIPLIIDITFFTQLTEKAPRPILFITFNSDASINLEESYLNLYAISKYILDNKVRGIILHPSLSNEMDQEIVQLQLMAIRKSLIENFSITPDQVKTTTVSKVPAEELIKNYSYDYMFTTF